MRRNKAWTRKLADSALALPAPEPESERQPTPVASDTEDHGIETEDQKRLARLGKKKAAAASQRAPAGSHPMSTRSSNGSRAGGFRGVVGSGSIGYVCDKSSPSRKPGSQSFSSAEVFLSHPIQQVQWQSVTTVTPYGT
jgi:hypothetical protein